MSRVLSGTRDTWSLGRLTVVRHLEPLTLTRPTRIERTYYHSHMATVAIELEDTATCDYCDATIGWVRQTHGRWMPIDPAPNELGSIAVLADGVRCVNLEESWVSNGERRAFLGADMPRYLSHFITCGGRGGVRPLGYVLRNPPRDPTIDPRLRNAIARDRVRDLGYRS